MSGGGKSSSATTTQDNRTAADSQALAVAGTSASQVARDSAISAAGSVNAGGLTVSAGGPASVSITDGGAVESAMSLVRDAGTSLQDSVKILLDSKQAAAGALSGNQVVLLIAAAVGAVVLSRKV